MKLQEYTFNQNTRKDLSLVDFLNDIIKIINFGRYQLRVVTSIPTWTGDEGELLLYVSGTVRRLYFYDITNSTWQYAEWNASGAGQSTFVAQVALTGQTGNITATTLYTPAASGQYRVSVYHLCTTAGAGTLTTTIAFTDDVQAQSVAPAANVDLAGAGNAGTGSVYIRSTAAAITYATSIAGIGGSPQYALFITVEKVS